MNACTITSYILAVALIAPAAGVFAAEQSGQGSPYTPYTGPDEAVMTTASNTEITRFGRDSVYVTTAIIRRQIHEHPAVA